MVKKLNAFTKAIIKMQLLKTNQDFKKNRLTKLNDIKNELVIIANGPSVTNSREKILSHLNADYMCVNLFPIKNELFWSIKPRYFCAIDNCFFDFNGTRANDVKELKSVINERIDWQMIFIHYQNQQLGIENSHILERYINRNYYPYLNKGFSNRAFNNNYMSYSMINVAIAALYSGILMGYKKIHIYGIDMTFFKDFFVDENNHVIVYEKHFYGDKIVDYTELYEEIREKGILRVFETNSEAFRGFKQIRYYADLNNCKIINHTPGSYVDAFERKER